MSHNAIDVLIVDRNVDVGMGVLDALQLRNANVTVVTIASQALKNVKRYQYDLILLGDRLTDGDTYDVGLELKTGKKNRRAAVLCMGHHRGRATKLANLLGSRALIGTKGVVLGRIRAHLTNEEEKSGARTS